jgi:phosphatidyl-myo-inositol dimannoside synthase
VVYNAIPDSFAKSLLSKVPPSDSITDLKRGNPLLLSVSSLVRGNEFKGIDTIIRALPKILRKVPDLQYMVVGEGEIRPSLESLAVEIGVAENVNFLGEIPDSELAELYRLCDVFALPSRGQARLGVVGGEGFGRVYVEAALAGKPVIGSLSGGAAEAVLHGETGLLVNPDSTDEVAEAVLAVLGDPFRAARMGSAGRNWALDRFSEEALSNSLKELLRPYGIENERLPNLVHAGRQP